MLPVSAPFELVVPAQEGASGSPPGGNLAPWVREPYRLWSPSWWWAPIHGSATVQRVNLFEFYSFGSEIRGLLAVSGGESPLDIILALYQADIALQNLLGQQAHPLITAKKSIQDLIEEIERIAVQIAEEAASEKLSRKRTEQIKQAQKQVAEFERIFKAEVESRAGVYSVSRKGAYDSNILIEQAELALTPESLRDAMPEVARWDLNQCGKCLAFEVPTASGFHGLRAVEAVIKQYYAKLAGKPWPYKQRDWGKYITELEHLDAPVEITAALTQTKDNYRNPLAHPEDVLTNDEAIGLFGMIVHILRMLLQEITRV